MPRVSRECYTVECDFCGEEYTSGDGVIVHWDRRSGVDIWDDDWRIWDDAEKQEHVWCPNCEPKCVCGHWFGGHEYGDADCEEQVDTGPGEPQSKCDCDAFKIPALEGTAPE